jgi:hypothetical protein
VKVTLETINQMQADGVIGKYAIGGAVGATFYLEPAATLDVDIFVTLPTVQFLPPNGSLEMEAVAESVSANVEDAGHG